MADLYSVQFPTKIPYDGHTYSVTLHLMADPVDLEEKDWRLTLDITTKVQRGKPRVNYRIELPNEVALALGRKLIEGAEMLMEED